MFNCPHCSITVDMFRQHGLDRETWPAAMPPSPRSDPSGQKLRSSERRRDARRLRPPAVPEASATTRRAWRWSRRGRRTASRWAWWCLFPRLDGAAPDRVLPDGREASPSSEMPSLLRQRARVRSGGVCRRFATTGENKFEDVGWRPAPLGSPILDGAVSWLECTFEDVREAGDHYIVLGRVDAFAVEGSTLPLASSRAATAGSPPDLHRERPDPELIQAAQFAESMRSDVERLARGSASTAACWRSRLGRRAGARGKGHPSPNRFRSVTANR